VRGVDPRLLRASRPARRHLALTVVLGLAGGALVVVQAVLLARAIAQGAFGDADLASLTPTLVALAVVFALRAGLEAAGETAGRIGAARVLHDLRRRLARHLLVDRAGVAGRRPAGEVATLAVQGVDALEPWLAGYLPRLALAAIVPPVTIAWLFTVDPFAAVVLALTMPVLVIFLVLVGLAAKARTEARWFALQRLGGHFLEVVQGLPTLRAHARDGAQADVLAAVSERYRVETMGTLRVAFLSALVLELAAMIGIALVAATVGVQLAEGRLGLEAGLTVLLLAPEMYAPLRQVGQQFHASADGTEAVTRLLDVLDEPATLSRSTGSADRVPDPAREPVALRGVSFAYPGREATVLRDVDLTLEPGRVTAAVGASGSGKSTLAALVLRLADPAEGAVTCGEVDLRDVDPDAWRARLAWVPQRPRVFAGTLADNVRLGDADATDEEVGAALAAACLGGLVDVLPDGVRTTVGEGGHPLSAGEAQRLALARAFVRPASLLVVDEPTAHLDADTARGVTDALARLAVGRTVLMLTHDPAVGALADTVFTVSDGRVGRQPVAAAEAVLA
jgi:ATP-binding cassette subfamily C protein CydD